MTWNKCKWITMKDSADSGHAPLLRHEFQLDAPITSAELSICGLGYYEAWLNSRRMGDHVLDPAQTDYEQRVFYVTYEVADLLRSGTNCIGVILGNGWFNQNRVWAETGLCYGQPQLLLKLDIQLADQTLVIVTSDESWSCAPGPITENNIYAGERYDARLEQADWNETGFDDTSWTPVCVTDGPGGTLEPQTIPPIRKTQELKPVDIQPMPNGQSIVDMGQNFAGWVRIQTRAPRGTEIQMRFAEALAHNGKEIDTSSTGTFATHVEQTDHYICRGDETEVWEPRFTCHGFRYVEVTGWPGRLCDQDITGITVHTDLPVCGGFECSDDRLNQLHRMALWTLRSNLHSIPEDCPTRERCGWLGDANMIAEFSMWNFHAKSFWEKYLNDIETTRSRNNGIPCNIAPGKRGTNGNANPDWAATFIMLAWYVYVQYGDPLVLENHWPGMTQLINHYREHARGWILEGGYGDWFDPGDESICTHTPPSLTTTLWFYRCAAVMREAAAALGRQDEHRVYTDWAQSIRNAFIDRFYQPDTGSFGSQTANAMALHLQTVPHGQEERITDALIRDIRARDTHLNTGIMGVRYLFETLSKLGYGETALELMHQDTYPGFGDLIRRGATTLWESWGETGHDRIHGPRSLNHPMMGGYDNWFYNTLAGIQPDPTHPGFRHFFLKPHPIQGLDRLKAHYDCPFGTIVSEWDTRNGKRKWKITVPRETRATAVLPYTNEVRQLAAGSHEIRF